VDKLHIILKTKEKYGLTRLLKKPWLINTPGSCPGWPALKREISTA